MTDTTSPPTSAPAVLQEHYRLLAAGPEAFGNGQGLRALLSDHLDFTGSPGGHRPDATDGSLQGVAGSVSTVRGIDVVREVHGERGSTVLHDAEMPGGTVRFAESSTVRAGVIETLDLQDDGQDHIAGGGR